MSQDQSASNVGRLVGCPTSFELPQSHETGDYAIRGNVIHDFLRIITVNPEGREAALAAITDEKIRATCEKINLAAAIDGIEVDACERAFVLNVKDRTVRVAGDDIDRKYNEALLAKGLEPLGMYDIPCTIDIVGFVLSGSMPCELDWKSGQSIGPIKDHWQRRVCSTALIIHYDSASCMSRVGYVAEDGKITPDGHEFSCLEIDDFCDEIVAAIDLREKYRVMLRTGVMPPLSPSDDNCKYCPAITSCPHHMNFVRALLGELAAVDKLDLKTLSLEEIGKAFDLYKKAEKILKRIETAGKLVGKEQPLPISDKYQYETRWDPGKSFFDGAKARGEIVKLMQAAGADEDAIAKKLESLNGKGASYPVFAKVKRNLPVVVAEPELVVAPSEEDATEAAE